MMSSNLAMAFSRRGCFALKTSRCILYTARRTQSEVLRFSTTAYAQRHGAIPTFAEPFSSPELTDMVARIRKDFMIPNHLSAHDRKLIYSSSLHDTLTTGEPYVVDVAGEKITLEPAPTRGQPGYKFLEPVVPLLNTPEDVKALVPALFQELGLMNFPKPTRLHKELVRKTIELGCLTTLLRVLGNPKTGWPLLQSKPSIRRIIVAINVEALQPDSTDLQGEIAKGLRRVQTVLSSIQALRKLPASDEESARFETENNPAKISTYLPRMPDVIGAAVNLAAMRVLTLNQPDQASVKETAFADLEQYVRMMRAASRMDMPVADDATIQEPLEQYFTTINAPAFQGLNIAKDLVRDSELKRFAEDTLKRLEPLFKDDRRSEEATLFLERARACVDKLATS